MRGRTYCTKQVKSRHYHQQGRTDIRNQADLKKIINQIWPCILTDPPTATFLNSHPTNKKKTKNTKAWHRLFSFVQQPLADLNLSSSCNHHHLTSAQFAWSSSQISSSLAHSSHSTFSSYKSFRYQYQRYLRPLDSWRSSATLSLFSSLHSNLLSIREIPLALPLDLYAFQSVIKSHYGSC